MLLLAHSVGEVWWSGLWPRAWVDLEIFELPIINLNTDIVCKMCFDSKVVDDPKRLSF